MMEFSTYQPNSSPIELMCYFFPMDSTRDKSRPEIFGNIHPKKELCLVENNFSKILKKDEVLLALALYNILN